jgi:acyl dehydratase
MRTIITQADIQAFALSVGDMNPVHQDPSYAAKTRFKTPIAHGMTAIVILSQMLGEEYQVEQFTIKFMKPIYPGY